MSEPTIGEHFPLFSERLPVFRVHCSAITEEHTWKTGDAREFDFYYVVGLGERPRAPRCPRCAGYTIEIGELVGYVVKREWIEGGP